MTINNYSELLTEVADWTKRSDMASRVPIFVAMGESAMNAKLRLRLMEDETAIALASGTASASLPTGFLEPISLAYSDGEYDLVQVPRDVLDASRAFAAVLGPERPRWYAFGASAIDFDRRAGADYTLSLRYFRKLDLAADTTNSVLSAAPFVYLYGALQAYASWIEDESATGKYTALFEQQLRQLEDSDFSSRGSAALRTDLPAVLNLQRFDITTG